MPAPLKTFTKDPDDVDNWGIDWSKELDPGETLIDSQWLFDDAADALLTILLDTRGSTSTVLWLSGGTIGKLYKITNRVTTSSSPARVLNHTLWFCVNRN